jgi:hypothetical protein
MACVYIDDDISEQKFNSFDIAQQPQRLYLPNEQTEIIPIVPLEIAIHPLIELVPTIDKKVKLAKQNCTNPSDGLSCDESAAIYLCSMRWEPVNECFYFILNATLRDHDQQKLKPWNLYLRLLFTALNRLPSTRITFYRGMEQDLVKNTSKGNFFIFWDFTFCSLSVALSKSNQSHDQIGKRTIFAFECCNAKFIEHHSCDHSKNEILLIPTQFQFSGYLDRKNDLDIIRLKEINELSPLIQSINMSNQSHSSTSITTSPSIFCQKSKLERLISLHQHRSEVNLTYQKLIADDMPIIIEQAIIGKQCPKLWLNNNQMTSECVSILVSALYNNTTLKELHLHETNISDESLLILTKALALNNCSITTLGISKNRITDKGVKYLIEMLETNTTLTHLILQPNPISKKGVKQLIKALANNTTLSIT